MNTPYTDKKLKERRELGNFHAIIGPNGMCACGPDLRCGQRLDTFLTQAINEAYEAGQRDGIRSNSGRLMYQTGYEDGKNKFVEALRGTATQEIWAEAQQETAREILELVIRQQATPLPEDFVLKRIKHAISSKFLEKDSAKNNRKLCKDCRTQPVDMTTGECLNCWEKKNPDYPAGRDEPSPTNTTEA